MANGFTILTSRDNTFFTNNKMTIGSGIPTSGSYKVGDIVISDSQSGGIFGWVCTKEGTPGEWEVIGSGAGGGNSVLVEYSNVVEFRDARTSIDIGISEYDKETDSLEVHYNGLLLAEGVHYSINEAGTTITNLNGSWNANVDDTQAMIFVVRKSTVGLNVVPIRNVVDINNATMEVEMGISNFNPSSDIISVHLNGVLLMNDIDYRIENGKIIKMDQSEAWNPNNVTGQKMYIEVLRNKGRLNEPSAGSIGKEHLTSELAGEISNNTNSVNSLTEIANNHTTLINNLKDQVGNIDFSEVETKIGKLPSLQTNAKGSLVDAVNELFQSANNGKELIADAIGEPLVSTDTFSAMSTGINGLLSTFKTNMMNNGVSVEGTDKFKQLIDKLATLSDSEGKGIKYTKLTGQWEIQSNKSTGKKTIKIPLGLDFTPSVIICYFPTYAAYGFGGGSYFYNNSGQKNVVITNSTPYINAQNSNSKMEITSISSESISVSNGFYTPDNENYYFLGGTCTEIYAIGVGEEDTTLEDTLRDILKNKGIEVTPEDDLASLITKVGNINITPVPAWYNKGFFINSSTTLSQSRAKASACTAKGKIYVMGGRTTATNYTTIYSTNECYDPNKNTIVTKTSLPYKVSELMLNNINDNIYCIGGNDGSNDLGLNLLYDVSNDMFTEKAKSRNTATRWGYAGTCTVENKIHHIGNNIHNVYDPITNTWTTAQSTKIETYGYGMQVHSYNKKIYVITHSYTSPYIFIYMYDTISNTWTSIANTGGMSGFYECSAIVDDKIFIFGGQENYIYSNYFDITKNKLVNNVNNQTTGRTYMACSAYNNTIYLFGGSTYSSTTNVYNVIMAYAVTN